MLKQMVKMASDGALMGWMWSWPRDLGKGTQFEKDQPWTSERSWVERGWKLELRTELGLAGEVICARSLWACVHPIPAWGKKACQPRSQ